MAGSNGSHFSGERQGIDRLASIHVSGDGAQLLLSAGKDMRLTGALVSHSGRDGLTYLGAGGDLQLDTVTEGYRQDSVGSASHYIKEQRWQDVGTEIWTVGDIILDAGNDARLTAARITSDDGLVQLRAQQDIAIGAGTLSSQLDERHVTKSRSLFGSKSKEMHWITDREQALASEVTGREVLLQSGQDIRITGSGVISDEGTYLQAGRDITLAGAEEYAFSDYHEKTKRSGVFGAGGIGVTIGSQSTEIDHARSDNRLRGTLVGSLAGDTVIEAGRQYSQEASTVSSPEGHVLITGQALEITAGEQPYSEHYRRVDKQSGLTVAMSAEAAAPILADYLYGKEATELNADEKATISSITGLVGAGVGASSGSDSSIAQGAQSAGTAVDNNWMSDYRGVFGVNQWGPGAASLVDAKLKENPDITPEELQSELTDYMTGAGYESGVSDGVVVWMVAPSAALGAGALTAAAAPSVITMIPSLGSGLKVYGLASLESVAGGIGTSSFLNEDYKLSNLVYDLSVGVLIDRSAIKIIDTSGVKGAGKYYLDYKGKITNHFLGDGVSSAFSKWLGLDDAILIQKSDWPSLLRSNDD
ncbi:Possible hemagglutinin (DUF638) [Oligella ureolytica]|uniref:Possible hemagglutinin (DUF638) n=1 Tax=Oligella ureolytica TaxID=90244 RepID=A0A378XFB0_9BURK|nr:VENN motif pre-toxin domain-containing protein [Oligella ureolytica]QPT40986.1 VENN motif pre-toxin domain-containing protein [Oligella ureolytica]SUA53384.1 Possible hemagglutinin (DUF638) [Oligella ureolytica]